MRQNFGTGPTRGIHGLTCTGNGGAGGIYLDGSGNTLEDISLSNFADGIVVGYNPTTTEYAAKGNVVLNVIGASSITNVVHICGSAIGDCPSGFKTVSDLSILQVTQNGATYTIEDGAIPVSSGSGPTLVTDSQLAILFIGGEPSPTGYSRFTTASRKQLCPQLARRKWRGFRVLHGQPEKTKMHALLRYVERDGPLTLHLQR